VAPKEPRLTLESSLKLQLKLSPKLQQAIKLLALPMLLLKERVEQELVANPVLEAEDPLERAAHTDTDLNDHDRGDEAWEAQRDYLPESPAQGDRGQDSYPDAETAGTDSGEMEGWEAHVRYDPMVYRPVRPMETREEDSYIDRVVADPTSLTEHLYWQLTLNCTDDRELTIAREIVGNLSEDGYLRDVDLQPLAEGLNLKPEVTVEEVERVLTERVHGLDPLGVGARSLVECLTIQLHHADPTPNGSEVYFPLASAIIKEHLPLVARRDYRRIAGALGATEDEVRQAVHLIASLDPKPARNYSGQRATYVRPDVFVEKTGDDYRVYLNEWGMPRLRISKYYRNVLNSGNVDRETRAFIRDKVNSAVWFIKNIDERRRTILRVTRFIFQHQRRFLEEGVEGLKPLTLEMVADELGVNPSTVSRATSGKYVQTPRGIFELKFFFSGGLPTTSGSSVSTTYIKEKIRKMIAEEEQPLSDAEIVARLKQEEGFVLARRTVAKYRNQMKIPPASKRKPL
jgi:RNA polymerase sigma-54 factor